tara:strand:+ start:3325 stop:4731 length:1407 start_codon:yes stop_codon:yes gene_type:complete
MFTLHDLVAVTGNRANSSVPKLAMRGIQIDSRLDVRNKLFVAIRSPNRNGDEYARDAYESGASAVLVHQTIEGIPPERQIIVPDTLKTLTSLGKRLRKAAPVKHVIGVTGSNGKTTAKDALAAALSSVGPVKKSPYSFNNELGVPITLSEIEKSTRFAVLELGAQTQGEIRSHCHVAIPTDGLITNIGRAHLGLFGSPEQLLNAKSELAEFLNACGTIALNADDPKMHLIAKKTKARVIWYGSEGPNISVSNTCVTAPNLSGSRIQLRTQAGVFELDVPAVGSHIGLAFAGAMALGTGIGIDPSDLAEGLQSFKPATRRMQIKQFGTSLILDDSYNSNKDSALYALSQIKAARLVNRRIAVLGDMLELGQYSEDDHYAVGAQATFLDKLYTVGHFSKTIGRAASIAGLSKCTHSHFEYEYTNLEKTTQAIDLVAEEIINDSQDNDLILIKGSNALQLDMLVDKLTLAQ